MVAGVCLLGAVLAFGVASLLQAHGARGLADGGSLLLRLAHNGPYVLGTLLDLVAVALTARALLTLPLFLVQGATSASLCITAIGAALLWPEARRLSVARTWGPVLGVMVGLSLLGSAAEAGPSSGLNLLLLLLLVAGVPLLLAGAGLLEGRGTQRPGVALAVLAGLAYAGMGVSLRAVPSTGTVITEPAGFVAGCYMACAFLLFARALQRLSVTRVMSIVVSIDTIVPSGLGLLLLGDRIRSGWVPAAVAGLLITVAAVQQVIRSSPGTDPGCPPAGALQPSGGGRQQVRARWRRARVRNAHSPGGI